MPTYDYRCPKCDNAFYEIMRISEYSQETQVDCPKCQTKCGKDDRDFSKMRAHFVGTKVVDAEFNYGLGCVVKNKRHKENLMKQKGLVEVGNDFGSGEKMNKHFEKQKDEELERKWEDPKEFYL